MSRGPPRQRSTQIGILLLLHHVLARVGLSAIPPVTLLAVAIMATIFTGHLDLGCGSNSNCALSAAPVIHHGEFYRLFLAAVIHLSDLHLYYNMVSFIWKGKALEGKHGSTYFLWLLMVLTALSGAFYVAIYYSLAQLLEDDSYMYQKAVGFSGVIFALKVLVTSESSSMAAFGLWTEVLVIQIMVPNASFVGHVAGVLAGFAYICGAKALRLVTKPVDLVLSRPVTVTLAVVLTSLHLNWIPKAWSTKQLWSSGKSVVCLNSRQILEKFNLIRFSSAPFEHAGDIHFGLCLFSLIVKGYELEKRRRPISFLVQAITSVYLTNIVYVFVAYAASVITSNPQHYVECHQGISGALFALKVLTLFSLDSFLSPIGMFELVELTILLEDRTRLMHLSGLLTGLLLWMASSDRFPGQGRPLGGSVRPQQRWTRSWGYADYHQDFVNSDDSYMDEDRASSIGASSASPQSRYQSFSPKSQSSVDSDVWVRSSIDVEDDFVLEDEPRQRRSATPSPSAPPYDPQWDYPLPPPGLAGYRHVSRPKH